MRLGRTDPLAGLLLRSPLGALVRWVAGVRAPVQRKLLTAFLLTTLLFLAMGAFSVYTIRSMSRQSELLDRAHQRVEWAQQIHHSLATQMHLTAMALLVRDEAALASILRENNRFSEALARLEEAVEEPERAVIQKIRSGQGEAMSIVADIVNLVRDGRIDAATKLHSSREDPLYRSIDALAKTPNQILGYVENMDGYYCSDCERVKPLFPAQPQVKLDLPCLGSVPFDPELAALCDRGGAPSDSHALFSWQPVRRIALEICQRVSERASAPEERA